MQGMQRSTGGGIGRIRGSFIPYRCARGWRGPGSGIAARSHLEADLQHLNPLWSTIDSRAKFYGVLDKLAEAGKCPPQLVAGFKDFYDNYAAAVTGSGAPGADEAFATRVQATIADTVFAQFVAPYTFPSLHTRILSPYDYYAFGQRYVGSLIDFGASALGNAAVFDEIEARLAAGHNVVLLANHQTEADPGVFAHMLAATHPRLAQEVIYVAGDRVVTDPLCKPFSMGRNLFCVHSKKHLDDVPELKAAKQETNRKTLVAMARALNEGGKLVWIAPSGGRDRPKADDTWMPDAFDPTAVELMRNLLSRAKQPGHLYPLAMWSWRLMPPPKTVDKALGERRLTNYTGVGISAAPELDVDAIVAPAGGDKDAAQRLLADAALAAVRSEYAALDRAITDPAWRASQPQFSQPWADKARRA
ncbi:MAG: glycerol-3-phosphate acyltransferase [Monoraphidium minutum]|nr:MAG: glycerol-3-phosphate acyltransferase [Monoraphidium minutum]